MRDCGTFKDLLSPYLEGDLPAEGRAELERHLEECPDCRLDLELQRRTVAALRGLKDLPAPAGILRGVREGIGTRPRRRHLREILRGRLFPGVPIGALATLIVAFGIFLLSERYPDLGRPPSELKGPPVAVDGDAGTAADADAVAGVEEEKREETAPAGITPPPPLPAAPPPSLEAVREAAVRAPAKDGKGEDKPAARDDVAAEVEREVLPGKEEASPVRDEEEPAAPAAAPQPAPPAPPAPATLPSPPRAAETAPTQERIDDAIRPAAPSEAGKRKEIIGRSDVPADVPAAVETRTTPEGRTFRKSLPAPRGEAGSLRGFEAVEGEGAVEYSARAVSPAAMTEILTIVSLAEENGVKELRESLRNAGGRILEMQTLDAPSSQLIALPFQDRIPPAQTISRGWQVRALLPAARVEDFVSSLGRERTMQLLHRTRAPSRWPPESGQQNLEINLVR